MPTRSSRGLRILVEPLLVVWELPQTLLGLAVFLMLLPSHLSIETWRGRVFLETRRMGASLGRFIIWTRSADPPMGGRPSNRAHEFGHAVQSMKTGPFYLLLVGLPSFSRATYAFLHRSLTGKSWHCYYDGYPERWADRLGAAWYRGPESGVSGLPSA